ncbi:MAG TPA: DUF998 domain-containing protein [Propionibacteriaceae bacterium]|jgi:lysylphosphatidylglycerol synthetase-like protein (DUF2156 family)|nr:DUF998 domain-containing protein [Propionibacteriaceae bacterium]
MTTLTTATASARDVDPRDRRLVPGGLAAGPVLGLTWLAQGLVRDGYDFSRHPMSLLALGEGGWVQIANFCLTGGLMLTCAASLRRMLTAGPGARWAPRLVAAIGAGLIGAGVFTTDPGAGFPEGAPAGAPVLSWHGVLHEISHLVVAVAWIALCFVLRTRFARQGDRGWARACVAVVPIVIASMAFPHLDSFPVRIVVASVVQLGFVGLAARRLGR